MKILAVDDSLAILMKVEMMVHKHFPGAIVVRAQSGHEGLEAWTSESPQVAILDHHMPDITGLEVAEKIRAEDSDVGILLLTADRNDSTQQSCEALGVKYLLKKDMDDLPTHLAKLILGQA